MGLAFITAVWGRVWCGWACPQTVFIDAVYRKIETLIEGNPMDRRRLDNAPWSLNKAFKRFSKWFCYLVVSLIITHSFVAYFVGSQELAEMISSPPQENWVSFLFVLLTITLTLRDSGRTARSNNVILLLI